MRRHGQRWIAGGAVLVLVLVAGWWIARNAFVETVAVPGTRVVLKTQLGDDGHSLEVARRGAVAAGGVRPSAARGDGSQAGSHGELRLDRRFWRSVDRVVGGRRHLRVYVPSAMAVHARARGWPRCRRADRPRGDPRGAARARLRGRARPAAVPVADGGSGGLRSARGPDRHG